MRISCFPYRLHTYASEVSLYQSVISMDNKIIVYVTGNEGKLREVEEILGPQKTYKLIHRSLDLNEYQGDVEQICKQKCQDAYKIVRNAVIVEDTSLCFNALGGMPGPYIKWFLEKIGPSGLHNMLLGFEDKTAVAICTYGFLDESGEVVLCQGLTHGTIVEPRGENGFGWDSCFQPKGFDQTYAEMNNVEKNQISSRKKAIVKLKEFLANKM